MESVANQSAPVVGFIDPTSGRYSKFATFNLSPGSFDLIHAEIGLAPDHKRHAVTWPVSSGGEAGKIYHAGWVDRHGKFTDVNADAPTEPGPFEGPPPQFHAIGFDGAGNFFYEMTSHPAGDEFSKREVYKLPNGQTHGAEIASDALLGAWIRRNGTGQLVQVDSDCSSITWLAPTEYLTAGGNNIYRMNAADMPGLGDRDCYSLPEGTPLLPATNTSYVADPVASPDGTRVAFRRNFNELWIVDSTGGGTPTRVNLTGIDLNAETKLIGWTSSP